ncbi:hypothetical protein AB4Z29_19285 [Paenibacillus sp. 2TAB23]
MSYWKMTALYSVAAVRMGFEFTIEGVTTSEQSKQFTKGHQHRHGILYGF